MEWNGWTTVCESLADLINQFQTPTGAHNNIETVKVPHSTNDAGHFI